MHPTYDDRWGEPADCRGLRWPQECWPGWEQGQVRTSVVVSSAAFITAVLLIIMTAARLVTATTIFNMLAILQDAAGNRPSPGDPHPSGHGSCQGNPITSSTLISWLNMPNAWLTFAFICVLDLNTLNLNQNFGPIWIRIWIHGYVINFERKNLKIIKRKSIFLKKYRF